MSKGGKGGGGVDWGVPNAHTKLVTRIEIALHC